MSKKPVIMLGAGGHAKVLINMLLNQGVDFIGLTDAREELKFTNILGVPIIGNDNMVFQHDAKSIYLVNGLGSTKSTQTRRLLFEKFITEGYMFYNSIHQTANIASDLTFGQGIQIMAGAIIQNGVSLGTNVIINTGVIIEHDCLIGDHVHVAPGAILSGEVTVGSGTHIGTGAVIIQGIKIGNNCLIAAGAVVVRDVPDNAQIMGVPGKVCKNERVEKSSNKT